MAMMMPVFMGSIDQSILASSLPTIGRDLGDLHDLPWVITSYLIASTALTPLYGKFADIHGRRASLMIALGIYMIGSLISASSTNMWMLIGGRVVQGCGGGGLVTTSQMVLGDIAPPKDRGKYYAYFSVAFTTAGAVGPALGGWICQHWHWSLIFLWNFPFCLIAGVLSWYVLDRLPRFERPHRLDFIGAVLVMASSSAFMLALTLGGVRFAWLSAPVLALIGCAGAAWCRFRAAAALGSRAAYSDRRIGRSDCPACHADSLLRLGLDHRAEHFSPDVSAERTRLVAYRRGLEPDHPDGHAEHQRRIDQPAHRPRQALQGAADTVPFLRDWGGARAGLFGVVHDGAQVRDHPALDRYWISGQQRR